MRIFLDTNIIISAALFPKGIAAEAYLKAVTYPNKGVICDWSIHELKKVYKKKFPDHFQSLNQFLAIITSFVETVPIPIDEIPDEKRIRDVNDRPILRAAQSSDVDILLTGDKDFLESGLESPIVVNPRTFIEKW